MEKWVLKNGVSIRKYSLTHYRGPQKVFDKKCLDAPGVKSMANTHKNERFWAIIKKRVSKYGYRR